MDERQQVTVSVTPTYSGCPAMHVIEREIVEAVALAGWPDVRLETVYSPAWTTDWIAEPARQKLVAYGIAAPPPAPVGRHEQELVPLRRSARAIPCPYCGSSATAERSEFGATACKARDVLRALPSAVRVVQGHLIHVAPTGSEGKPSSF